MKILGLIPARGGSKGLPRKNLLRFFDRPLIWWSIEAARKSELLDDYYVTTEDKEIADTASLYGCKVIPRPDELAQDDSTTIDVVKHALEYIDEEYDYVALLQPTNPMRKRDDLYNAIDILISNPDYDAIIDYVEAHEHPYLMRYISGENIVPVLGTTPMHARRQDYPRVYYQNGAIYVCKTEILIEEKTFAPEGRTLSYILEPWQRYDIDDIYDFLAAEAVMKRKWMEVL